MSYTPTNWQTGDIITAAKLNNMEQGITSASDGGGSSILVITGNTSGASTVATSAEVLAAAAAVTPIFIKWGSRVHPAVIEQIPGGDNYLYAYYITFNPEAGGLWWGRWSIALTGTALGRLYYSEEERIALGTVGVPSLDWANDGDVVTFYQGNVIWANPSGGYDGDYEGDDPYVEGDL